jgi:HK97 family phage prohead protease
MEPTNEMERRTLNIKTTELRVVRAVDGKPQAIEGYAAVFDEWSQDLGWFREKIAPGAFDKALKTSDVRCLFNHNSDFIPLGRTKSKTLELKPDKKGLWFRDALPDAQFAYDLAASIERGDIDGCSFAFTTEKDSWVYSEDGGRDERTILEVRELFDVGPVVYPAYTQTSVSARDLEVAKRSLEAWKASGQPAEENTPEPEKREESQQETPKEKPLLDSAKQRMEAAEAERRRKVAQALADRLKKNAQKNADAQPEG